jgi:hypothetical protein
MSTARAPNKMPIDFAREIRNMYLQQDGAGRKRNGVTAEADALSGVICRLMFYITLGGDLQILAATDDGKISLKVGTAWQEVYNGLNTQGTVRWTHFAGRLVLCNGLDDPLSWDGSAMRVIEQKVVDKGANLTFVSSTQFSIESDAAFYAPGTEVRARLGGSTFVTSTVASVTGTTPLTVTLNDAVLTNTLDQVEFTVRPPRFSYIYAAHDRLWGFGNGALKAAGFSDSADRSRVFYTAGLNDETAWYDADGLLQSINLADKIPVLDELTAMAVKDGLTVFFFREHTQLWSGADPTLTGDFSWVKTLPLGVIHGDLVIELPNDVGFFTRFGARTLSRTLQTEQLDIGDLGAEINPTLTTAAGAMLTSDAAYRGAQAFRYDQQGWFGFKPVGPSLVFQVLGAQTGWTMFDGFFESATAFLNTPDGKLYLAVGGQLYFYDETVWADAGSAITTRWWTPWLNIGSNFKRWANKFYEVVTDQGAGLSLTLKRYKNYNSSSFIESSVTASVAADYWDETDWNTALWDNGAPTPERERDHFIADVFSYALESNSAEGPLTVFGFKLHGVRER